MKKILEVFGEPIERGGQEIYLMNALKNMDLSGMNIDIFTPYYCKNEEYKEFVGRNSGKIYEGNLPFIVGKSRKNLIPVFKKILEKKDYDVVHIHSGSTSVLAYCAKTASKEGIKKIIVHSHSSGEKENIKHFFIKKYTAKLFEKYPTNYFACSLEAARWKYPNSIINKTKIMKNGVDLLKFKYDEKIRYEYRKKYKIENDTIVLGHVGRFSYEKNQKFLVDVLHACMKKIKNKRIILMLVGEGAELYSVKKRVKEYGLDDMVIFTGVKENINEYMQMFDVFLFPSFYEGLGYVGIEAQAAGLPVIASQTIPRLMKIKEHVTFLDLTDIEQWVLKICEEMNFRDVCQDDIKNKGFDIVDTSLELRKIYCDD